jgi:hypothetical protein
MNELKGRGIDSWEIGYVKEGNKTAILENVELLEV